MINNPVTPNLGTNGVGFFQNFIPKLITIALIAGSLIFFFNLVIGAIQWISSGGDKQSLEGAKARVSNAIIGIIVLFAVFAIAKLIQYFFGIELLSIDIGSLVI